MLQNIRKKLVYQFKDNNSEEQYYIDRDLQSKKNCSLFSKLHMFISLLFVFANLVVLDSSSQTSGYYRLMQIVIFLVFYLVERLLRKKYDLTWIYYISVILFCVSDTLILFDTIKYNTSRVKYYDSVYGIFLGILYCGAFTVLILPLRFLAIIIHAILLMVILPSIYTSAMVMVVVTSITFACFTENMNRKSHQKEYENVVSMKNLQKCIEVFKEGILIITKKYENPKAKEEGAIRQSCQEDIFELEFPYANNFFYSYFNVSKPSNYYDTEYLQAVTKVLKTYKITQEEKTQEKMKILKGNLLDEIYKILKQKRFSSCENSATNQFKVENVMKLIISTEATDECFELRIDNTKWEGADSVIVVFHNITQQLKAQRLEEINQQKDQVLANVTHDLKNPILGVGGFINSVQEQLERCALHYEPVCEHPNDECTLKSDMLKTLNQMRNTNSILMFLVRDIQDMALIKHNKLSLYSQKVQLKQLCLEITNLFNDQVQKKNIEINLAYSSDLKYNEEIQINTDPIRLQQVVMNLVSNSVKYTQKGYIEVNIESQKNKEGILKISVKDTGMGMKPSIKNNLFKQYNSFDQKTGSYGVGLGLCIIENLVNKLGPKQNVQVESEEGKGSTFSFLIFQDIDVPIYSGSQTDLNCDQYENDEDDSEYGEKYTDQVEQNDRLNSRGHKVSESVVSRKDTYEYFHNLPRNLIQQKKLMKHVNTLALSQHIHGNSNHLNGSSIQSPVLQSYKPLISPTAKCEKPLQSQQQSQDPQVLKVQEFLSSYKDILIIDDQQFNIMVQKMQIQKLCKNKLHEAISGEQGIEIFQQQNDINLVFTDNHMGTMDGFETAKKLKQINSNIDIYLLTAMASDAYTEETNGNSTEFRSSSIFKGIIEKPLNVQKLYEAISKKQ